jgi:hypothetical protein
MQLELMWHGSQVSLSHFPICTIYQIYKVIYGVDAGHLRFWLLNIDDYGSIPDAGFPSSVE